jgi:hypothetical protein
MPVLTLIDVGAQDLPYGISGDPELPGQATDALAVAPQ